jgi:hypothetical protein
MCFFTTTVSVGIFRTLFATQRLPTGGTGVAATKSVHRGNATVNCLLLRPLFDMTSPTWKFPKRRKVCIGAQARRRLAFIHSERPAFNICDHHFLWHDKRYLEDGLITFFTSRRLSKSLPTVSRCMSKSHSLRRRNPFRRQRRVTI